MTNEELVEEYQNGNAEALDELMQQNTGLVMYFANKYFGLCQMASMDIDDIVQEGFIGLMVAACRYNSNKPIYDPCEYNSDDAFDESLIKCEPISSNEDEPIEQDEEKLRIATFATFACYWIKSKMLRALNRAIPKKYKNDITTNLIVNSVDEFLPGSEETTLLSRMTDKSAAQSFSDIETDIDNQILRKDLLFLLDSVFGGTFQYSKNVSNFVGVENIQSLFEKICDGINSKEVLLLHYGLFGKPMTHKEIAKLVGLSAARIEQIEFKAIGCIRHSKQGKQFMKKYELPYIQYLEGQKEFNQFMLPEKAITKIETIEEMLKKYIN